MSKRSRVIILLRNHLTLVFSSVNVAIPCGLPQISPNRGLLQVIVMSPAVKIFLILGLLGGSHSYDLGVQYMYKYHTEVSTGEHCQKDTESKNVGFQLTSTVYITCIWQNEQNKEEKLLKIEFIKPSLLVPKKSVYQAHDSKLERISQSPLYFEWINGEIKTVFGDTSEDPILKNLKKGVASLFQVKLTSSPVLQKDVSGDCVVQVEADGRFLRKKKENCFHPTVGKRPYNSSEIRSSNVTSFSVTNVELAAQESRFVLSAGSTDYFTMQSNIWKRPAVCVHSKTSLSLENESSTVGTMSGKSLSEVAETLITSSDGRFKKETIIADIIPKECGDNCKHLSKIIGGYKESLATTNLAKLKSASSFLKLLEVFRLASEEEIVSALRNKKFKSITPQLIDIIAYAGSQSSLHAAVQAMDIFHKDSDLVERLLLSICTSSHPNAEMLQTILDKLRKGEENKKVHATLVVALGALTKSFTKNNKEESDNEILGSVENFFTQQLKSCKLLECQMIYLRGLRNAALPSSVPLLLEYVEEGGKLALEALLALKNIDPENFDSKAVTVFKEVFQQTKKKQVSSARAVAAELLLKCNPGKEVIQSILGELRKPENSEFATFLSSKIYNIMENDQKLREEVKKVLENEGVKYHSVFTKGSSVSFKKPLMTAAGVNTTYGIEMEMLPGGSMKRSLFDVNLYTPESSLHVLSVGIYAEGLANLGGTDESAKSDEDGDATAGMELTVFGVSLRPYIFFEGASELFSLVWRGAGSELTPALQGNMLIIDDATAITLQNGFQVDVNLKGAFSADLSALTQISLWYKNSHSVVNNAVALLVKGSAHIDTSFINFQEEFSFMGEGVVEFITDLDFSDEPYRMCLQMKRPEIVFRNNFLVTEQIPGSKYSLKTSKKRKLYAPAQSFLFHQNNNEQCASLLESAY